jgi:hypothetical protein
MITKQDIEQWLSDTANLDNQAEAFNTKIEDRVDLDLTGMIEQCFNDLQGWVSVDENTELVEGVFYWVLMPSGRIDMMYFNNYKQYGGTQDYWQDLSGSDYTLENTRFIEIVKPAPPK